MRLYQNQTLKLLLSFRFELNPGKKKSILSYKNLHSFIISKNLYLFKFREYWNPFNSCPQQKSRLSVPLAQCQLWGLKPFGWGFLETVKLASHQNSHDSDYSLDGFWLCSDFWAPRFSIFKLALWGSHWRNCRRKRVKSKFRYYSFIRSLGH